MIFDEQNSQIHFDQGAYVAQRVLALGSKVQVLIFCVKSYEQKFQISVLSLSREC